MAVITISRELGSEGSYISRKVAENLGFIVVDKDMIESILGQYGFVQFDKEYNSSAGLWERMDGDKETMIKLLNRVIEAMAHQGNVVILGRGSFAVLAGYADVLNVRIQAPFTIRVKRVMQERRITDLGVAEALVKEGDKVRLAFIQSWYNVGWSDARAFDLVVDTGKISRDLAVDWIVTAFKQMKPIGPGKLTSQIEVDPILTDTVTKALQSRLIFDAG